MNESAPPLRVIVADDQASVREGLVLLLGIFAKTGSRDRAAAIRYAREHGLA
jgi:hypothetical protein